MTHARAPGSIEQALDRIAGEPLVGGWAAMATIVDRGKSTVRKCANLTTPKSISLDLALRAAAVFARENGETEEWAKAARSLSVAVRATINGQIGRLAAIPALANAENASRTT